jgi:hypothetical protein
MSDEDILKSYTDSFIITKKFRSSNEFSLHIEEKVLKEKLTYMEAVIQYCEEVDIDIEAIANLINQSLKEKIKIEAEDNNYMKKRAKLPL